MTTPDASCGADVIAYTSDQYAMRVPNCHANYSLLLLAGKYLCNFHDVLKQLDTPHAFLVQVVNEGALAPNIGPPTIMRWMAFSVISCMFCKCCLSSFMAKEGTRDLRQWLANSEKRCSK